MLFKNIRAFIAVFLGRQCWEFRSRKKMLNLLVGNYLGPEPEKAMAEIMSLKQERAECIAECTKMTKQMNVLEFGSGCGFMSPHIARRVGSLVCCDISKSFLKFAKKECRDINNISFHHIKPLSFSLEFLSSKTMDVIFAESVFIHLNLYDIFWYLKEFRRVIKPGGLIFFDIMNEETLDLGRGSKFIETADCYKEYYINSFRSVEWNSSRGVIAIAKHFGFELIDFANDRDLLFHADVLQKIQQPKI